MGPYIRAVLFLKSLNLAEQQPCLVLDRRITKGLESKSHGAEPTRGRSWRDSVIVFLPHTTWIDSYPFTSPGPNTELNSTQFNRVMREYRKSSWFCRVWTCLKPSLEGQVWWLMPVIAATQEAEIRRIVV
jgi:hypothetical protein